MTPTHVTCPRCEGTGGEFSFVSGYRFERDSSGAVTSMTWAPGDKSRQQCPMCRGTGKASMLEPLGDGRCEYRGGGA